MTQFDALIGEWQAEADIPIEPPMHVSGIHKLDRLGSFVVWTSVSDVATIPDAIAIIGGANEGEPQPMHYFDSRGVKRMFATTVEGSTWTIWRAPGEDWNGPDGPGFNQRFFGEISADGTTIEGRWERGMGDAGDQWELDFPISFRRT
ncbi:MAG TPA: hypothetical protein VKA85_08230 [Candidatus Limnocylindrales bacterium]|nr:hypothetical protein [Candidatus Limnocylindrales bacterium]